MTDYILPELRNNQTAVGNLYAIVVHDISIFELFTIPASIDKAPEIAGLFHQVHVLGIWAFIAMIVLHVGAALYHHFILRNNILIRIIK